MLQEKSKAPVEIPPVEIANVPQQEAPHPDADDSGGKCKTLSINEAADLSKVIQTVGANGAIDVLADKVKAYAATLLAEGKITQDQMGMFNDLANQGYKVGDISGLIETASKNCGSNSQCFLNQTVIYNGKSISVSELSTQIGYSPLSGTSGPTSSNPAINTLWNLYSKLAPVVWKNPEIKAVITALTTQIGAVSDHVMWGTWHVQQGYFNPGQIESYIVTQTGDTKVPKTGNIAQGTINKDSTTICVSGNGESDGTSCQ
jgi:hypothetical protein